MDDILREPVELIDQDLDEVAGGSTFVNSFAFSNVGVGQLNQDSVAIANLNIGIGQLNVED